MGDQRKNFEKKKMGGKNQPRHVDQCGMPIGKMVLFVILGLMDFNGPKKIVIFSGPKFGSTKVHKYFFPHFAKASGI